MHRPLNSTRASGIQHRLGQSTLTLTTGVRVRYLRNLYELELRYLHSGHLIKSPQSPHLSSPLLVRRFDEIWRVLGIFMIFSVISKSQIPLAKRKSEISGNPIPRMISAFWTHSETIWWSSDVFYLWGKRIGDEETVKKFQKPIGKILTVSSSPHHIWE